jgi:Carboxypeptidase regulatory-like domain/TonB dependent receptor-like, beta-barrel/TonB-dependent Receptor Plug Domain
MFQYPRRAGISLTLLFLLLVSVAARAQNPTGVIDGTIRDQTDQAVPGVTVLVNGASLIQKDLAVVSNAEGFYRLQLLPPGVYTVRYELAGFQSVQREGLIVAAGQATTINIKLNVSSVQESVTVRGESPTVDTTSAKLGFNTTRDLVENVPTRRDFSSLMATIPGVEGQAGNTGVAGNLPRLVVLGAGSMANSYTFDGANVLDPGISSDQTAKFSYDIVEEVQVIKAAKPAEVGFAQGGSFQIITKSGGNDFHGDASGYYRGDSLQSDNVTADLKALGVGSTSNRVIKGWDTSVSPGGRIIKDRLWWFGSGRRQQENLQLLGYPDPQISSINAAFAKATYQPDAKNRIAGSYQDWREEVNPFFRSMAPSQAGDANVRFLRRPTGRLGSVRWNSTLTNTILATAGFAQGKQTLSAVWPDVTGIGPGIRDLVTAFRYNRPDVLSKEAPSWNTNVSGSLSWFVPDAAGRHDVKMGAEYTTSKVINAMSAPGGDYQLRTNSGVPAQVILLSTPISGDARIKTTSLFVQDGWTIRNKLTLNVGARYDRFTPSRQETSAGGGTWANTPLAITYPVLAPHPIAAVDPQWTWNSVAPRLAVSFTPDPRTVLRASYSRYYHYVNTGMIPGADENVVTSLTLRWTDSNGDQKYQIGEEGALLSRAGGPDNVSFDRSIRHPYTDELVVGVSRELFADFSVSANYIHRHDTDLIHTMQVGIPDSAYTPVAAVDPGPDGVTGNGDDHPITVYSQNPATFGQEQFIEANPSAYGKDNDRMYDGFELVANRRLSHNIQFVGSLIAQKMTSLTPVSDFYTSGLFFNPNDQINATGRDPAVEPVLVKLQGTYSGKWGVLVSGYYRYSSGVVYTRQLVVRGLPQGTTTIFAEPLGSSELPHNHNVDVRVEKSVRIPHGARIAGSLDVFNLLNASTITAVGTSTGVNLGRPQVIVNPRIARVGVRLTW